MDRIDGQPVYSATDLVAFLAPRAPLRSKSEHEFIGLLDRIDPLAQRLQIEPLPDARESEVRRKLAAIVAAARSDGAVLR